MNGLLIRLLNAPSAIRQSVAFGISASLSVAVLLIGLAMANHISTRLAGLDAARDELGVLTALIAEGVEAKRADTQQNNAANAPLTLAGDVPDVAAAGLQTWLSGQVEALGLDLASVDIVRPKADDATPFVGVSANLSGPADKIMGLIAIIESANPPLFIRQMHLNAIEPPVNDAGKIIGQRGLSATILFGGYLAARDQKS